MSGVPQEVLMLSAHLALVGGASHVICVALKTLVAWRIAKSKLENERARIAILSAAALTDTASRMATIKALGGWSSTGEDATSADTEEGGKSCHAK